MALFISVSGCGSKEATPKTSGSAKGAITIARSALSTMAPDAKLLLVQTATATKPSAAPVWAYLFGSPETDKTYVVYVENGKAMPASEYGTAGLEASEWSSVPGIDAWKIDSDEAYTKALAASGAKGDPEAYDMGLLTYVPPSANTSTTSEAFMWYVQFVPGTSGATDGTVQVNAKTGETKVE